MAWQLYDQNGQVKTTASTTTPVFPSGMITMFGGSTAPTGWLLCDGSAVSRTTFSALFGTIGTANGVGDGSTTFNVPDMRGRTAVGLGTHTDVAALGQTEGVSLANRTPKHSTSTSGSISLSGAPALTGTVGFSDPGHTHTISVGGDVSDGNGNPQGYANFAYTKSGALSTSTTGISVTNGTLAVGIGSLALTNTFAVGPTGTRPVDTAAYTVVNFIIKT